MCVPWCRTFKLVEAAAANPPTALCRMLQCAFGSCPPHAQDAKAGSCYNHVSAAECSSGSLSVQCSCGILSGLRKFSPRGMRASPYLCGGNQQHWLPGQQPVCGAGMDQGAVPGRLRLPCRPQCRWAILKGVQDTAAAPCHVHTSWMPPFRLLSKGRSTSPECLSASLHHSRMPDVRLTEALEGTCIPVDLASAHVLAGSLKGSMKLTISSG